MADITEFTPVIRMELEGMRAQIIHHLSGENAQWEAALGKAVDEAVTAFPWKSEIRREAMTAIQDSISEYFKKGEGAVQINRAVVDAIKDCGFTIDRGVIRDLLEDGITLFSEDEY